jgi:hypothetical protein
MDGMAAGDGGASVFTTSLLLLLLLHQLQATWTAWQQVTVAPARR